MSGISMVSDSFNANVSPIHKSNGVFTDKVCVVALVMSTYPFKLNVSYYYTNDEVSFLFLPLKINESRILILFQIVNSKCFGNYIFHFVIKFTYVGDQCIWL